MEGAAHDPVRGPLAALSTSPDGASPFAEFAEHALVGIFLIDGGRFAYANPAFERMFGYGPGELLGKDPLLIVHPGDRPFVADNLQAQGQASRQSLPAELRGLCKNGDIRYFQALGFAADFAGRRAVLGTAVDVTQQRNAEAALRTSEAQYRLIADQVEDVLWRLDLTTRAFTYVSPSVERLRGYTPAEVLAGPVSEAFGPDALAAIESFIATARSAVKPSGPAHLRLEQPRKDGRPVATEVTLNVVRDGHGELREIIGVTRNIEERERAERALKDSEARFRALIDGAPVAIGVSRGGTTILVNEAYVQLFGCKDRESLVGASLIEQIAPCCRHQVLEWSRRRAEGEMAPSVYETTGLRTDGLEFPVHVAVAEVDLPDGPATVGFLTDITQLKQAQADLAFESSVESALLDALHGLPEHATAEEAADALCDAMWTLPKVSFAAVFAFGPENQVRALAHRAPFGFPPAPGDDTDSRLHEIAEGGPRAEYWHGSPDDGAWEAALTEFGLQAAAYAPIGHGDHVDGLLMVGTCDPALGRTFVDRLPSVVDFASTSSALLAERLHNRRDEIEAREVLERAIEDGAFFPVFQPIVDLNSRRVVGFEALTRFSSGLRPDLYFAEAWQLGIGPKVELATLERAIAAAQALPGGKWLDLNVSPRLLAERDRLRAALSRADRPLVLEITEHDTIDDYSAVRNGLRSAHPGARLAVDDAGAGIANFAHIVELRPDLVKLDMGLVRQIDSDRGRQAVVTGMCHFARAAGCRLIAEGVETEAEAETLKSLGVDFGQGWYFGRPVPVKTPDSAARAAARASARRAAR